MKVVLLAGGLGTRISEETQLRPKPMVEIGGMPILWHTSKYLTTVFRSTPSLQVIIKPNQFGIEFGDATFG